MDLHHFHLDITLEYIIPWLKQTARFEVQPKDSVLHKEASRFTTGGIERQPSIVVIYWLQSQGVFMTHARTIRIGLNSERLWHPRERRETPSTPAMLKHSEITQELHERDKEENEGSLFRLKLVLIWQ